MGKQRRQPSFSEIVDAVKSSPQVVPPEPTEPGIYPDGTVLAPDRRRYVMATTDISSDYARAAGAGGAIAAWDPCGCGGFCGLTWFDEADVARMAASGRPTIRRTKRAHGSISEYRSDDGRIVLLVEGDVRWGEFFA
ncbi:hypothetical protein [Cellulomonas sp. PhB150]|uniref:hypothetical protein n=1 Tax=Cellulomonas sp. PhB150 TaxID=2485188 RepID=UPI000F46DDAC|nr:hypothetical protein [Cellulomonas sp. PhB150]ROS21803.1 hypothetical protein EDF34_3449 [Cellulomonas sp. PhB150]